MRVRVVVVHVLVVGALLRVVPVVAGVGAGSGCVRGCAVARGCRG